MASKTKNSKTKKKRQNSKQTSSPLAKEITLLAIIIFSLLALLSLFGMCGPVGNLIGSLLFGLFGITAYIFPLAFPIGSGFFISNPENPEVRRKIIYLALLYICLCAIFQWVIDPDISNLIDIFKESSSEHIGGGFIGGILSTLLGTLLGRAGAIIIILGLTLLFVMLTTRKLIFSAIRELYVEHKEDQEEYIEYEEPDIRYQEDHERTMQTHTFADRKRRKKADKGKMKELSEPQKTTEKSSKEMPVKEEKSAKENIREISIIREGQQEPTVYKEELETKFGKSKTENPEKTERKESSAVKKELPKPEKQETISADSKKAEVKSNLKPPSAPSQDSEYKFPSLDLLSKPKKGSNGQSDRDLLQTAKKLQDTLDSFGVKVKMGDVSCGPSVTRYELVPEQGVKVNSITRLADDIKLSLAASDIRIEAPIPGKAAVGIEVPNAKRNTVTLRELLESPEFINAKSNVTFAVGKDIGGKTIVTDIAKMPHMLIAGATGSGKSVCINTLIMSILYKANPNDVKFIMVDPKMVELTAYADIPHMLIPVVTDPKKASAALNWAVQEMTVRYEKFAALGVRDIKSYNKKIAGLKHNEDNTYEKMCQIVIVVDEFADLMMVASNEVEDAVCRLAQLARAAGIHLVLATQRPSVNVITGLIKANIPSRIALSVSSAIDSRTIIDGSGAEKLLGNGDMLFAPQDYPKPVRVQGAFVSDEERDQVVAFLKEHMNGPAYNEEISKHIEENPVGTKSTGASGAVVSGPERDELFVEAARFIIEKDKASIGMLQRVFRIGFNRAARIMDQLSDAGVVGPEEGTKPRVILMSMEQFENYLEEEG
ncbi:cell divisionFtsK/SpoIIIE [Roseburia sp. CAG:309]|nr:cell divisionFtsK/SpoIIIE [Roseburia sp. CAG:309]